MKRTRKLVTVAVLAVDVYKRQDLMCERCTVHHGRHANGDNRHAECFLVERRTGVSHAGPRRNAGSCQLDGVQQPGEPSRRKGIHRDDSGRAHAVEHLSLIHI